MLLRGCSLDEEGIYHRYTYLVFHLISLDPVVSATHPVFLYNIFSSFFFFTQTKFLSLPHLVKYG